MIRGINSFWYFGAGLMAWPAFSWYRKRRKRHIAGHEVDAGYDPTPGTADIASPSNTLGGSI